MGNQPNNFIQCGYDSKDTKQQVGLTREQVLNRNKDSQNFQANFVQSKLGHVTVTSDHSGNSNSKIKIMKNQSIGIDKKIQFTPQHQNIVKVSKTPKNKYLKISNEELYSQQKGICLDEILSGRFNTTMHFPEYQVISLLESLVYSLAYLVKKEINYHDFYPTNVFYNNGIFKIANPLAVKLSGYSLTHQRKRFSFLSPEQILQIIDDRAQQQIQKAVMDKSDIFSIGMILLQFCSLQPSSECYDPETYSIIDSIIQERIQKIRNIYNPLIAESIDLMLQYEVQKRITPSDLSFAVHSKVKEIKQDENNDMSRLNIPNRISMSAKLPPLLQAQVPFNQHISPFPVGLPQNQHSSRIYYPPQQPLILQSHPLNINPQAVQGFVPQQFLPPGARIIQQQIPAHISQSNNSPTNRKSVNSISNIIGTAEENYYTRNRSSKQQNQDQFKSSSIKSSISSNNDSQFSFSAYRKVAEKPVFGSQLKIAEPLRQSGSPYENQYQKQAEIGSFSNSKGKGNNPFEEIKQDVKEEQEQFSSLKSNDNRLNYVGQKYPLVPNYQGKANQQYGQFNQGPSNLMQESLDERVRRILEASKNIK